MMALVTLALLYVAGLTLGVRLRGGQLVADDGPDARRPRSRSRRSAILLGHLLTADSIGPAIGGMTALFALLGGVWFPVTARRDARDRRGAALLLARPGEPRGARRQRLGSDRLVVVAAWTVVAAAAARRAYARDTQRV